MVQGAVGFQPGRAKSQPDEVHAYLWTRLMEQVVHLDDLARSLGIDSWLNAGDADALAISCGAEVGRLRFGGPAMIRTLLRNEAGALPVI